MDFSLSQEQTILKNEARRFLKNECPIDFVREMMEDDKGYSPSLWKKMAELGWMGLLFEERYGGSGGTFLDLSLILEEMGRALLPGPFFSTVILGGVTIMQGANEKIKQRILPGVANGDIISTMAMTETEGGYSIEDIKSKGELKEDGFILSGNKMFVSNAHIANYIIFPVITHQRNPSKGISLLMVDGKSEGVNISSLITLALEKLNEVSFKDVYAPQDSLIGEMGKGWTLIQNLWPFAVTGKCCELVGAMQRVLEMSVDYAQKRHQFGHPLSSFQVIQHYCADMAIDLECSRFITYQAAWNAGHGLPPTKEVAMAKAWCSNIFKKITTIAHQIHGAIGLTKEHDLNLYFRYAKAGEIVFGDANFHKEALALQMGL